MSQFGTNGNGGGGGGGANSFPTDNGTATPAGGVLNIIAGVSSANCGQTVEFTGSGNTVELNVSDFNFNTFIGLESGASLSSGTHNTGVGALSLAEDALSGVGNCALGWEAGLHLTTSTGCTILGAQALSHGSPGNYNFVGGFTAASNWTGGEDSNIIIGNPGVASEANTIRLGTTGNVSQQQNRCFIAGIDGVNLATDNVVVAAGDQLGTAVLTAGSGISITAGTNTITIAASGGSSNAAFFAYVSTTQANATGDGFTYQVIFDTANVNVGSNYDTATGFFTAPATGLYLFSCSVALTGLSTQTEATLIFHSTAVDYYTAIINPVSVNVGGVLAFNTSIGPINMSSGDTMSVEIQVVGGARAVNIFGLTGPYYSYFSGNQIA